MGLGGNNLAGVLLAGGRKPVTPTVTIDATLDSIQPSFPVDVAVGVTIDAQLDGITASVDAVHGVSVDLGATLDGITPAFDVTHAPQINVDIAAHLDSIKPAFDVWHAPRVEVSIDATLDSIQPAFDALIPPSVDIDATLDGVAVSIDAFHDWAAGLDPLKTQTYYACDIEDPVLETIRVPVSSWQATLQTDRSSFLQAVIPAADPWLGPIADRPDAEVVIRRGARFEDGSTEETELARAPIRTPRHNRGPTKSTLTVTGYRQMVAPSSPRTRTVTGVRSVTTSPDRRVRCEIDWFLRPGDTVNDGEAAFVADYINYYVNRTDAYMDVGERVE